MNIPQDKATIFGLSLSLVTAVLPRASSSLCSQFRVRISESLNLNIEDYFLEELGYLVDAIINTGDIASYDSDKEAGKLSHEDKILLSR